MWNKIKMALKSLFLLQNHKNCPAAGGYALRPLSTVIKHSETMPRLRHTWAASVCSARGINQAILGQKKTTFGSHLLSKIMVLRLVAFTAADRFFNLIMGRRRNELRNAAGPVFWIAHIWSCTKSDYQFLYAKSSVYFSAPPALASAPHFAWSGDGAGWL